MRYKTLGGTGLLVSEICLGTMTFGGGGYALDEVSRLPPEYPGWMMERQKR